MFSIVLNDTQKTIDKTGAMNIAEGAVNLLAQTLQRAVGGASAKAPRAASSGAAQVRVTSSAWPRSFRAGLGPRYGSE